MSLLPFKKVRNRYQLKERLGTGGMGIVYRAYDTVIHADIALKTLTDVSDPIALRMFREECDKLAKIIHPNVVEIRDVGELEENGTRKPYMVMPFLRGKTLDRLLLDSPDGLPLERALEILVQAARGLQATHEAGLIHRDIKPSNVFVLDDDSVKLIDFGVAHYSENLVTHTRKGTLMYMAPEQVMLLGISPLSDIFSLGVVAYETLTGRRPFEGRAENELIDKIVHRNPLPASRLNAQLNASVDQTLQKALAKLPEYRIQSAREFGEFLRKAVLNQPIAIFNRALVDGPVEQAQSEIGRGNLDSAGKVLDQLERQGWLDDRILEARQELEHLRNQRAVASLLASARVRIGSQDFVLAAKDVDEILQLEPRNSDAAYLRKEIERARTERDVSERLGTARRTLQDRAFREAKEAVEQALEIWPNEPAARALRADIQKTEQDYIALVNEKRRAARRAERALKHCEPESAREAIQHAMDLDQQAPEAGKTTASLQNLSKEIAAASREAQDSLERGRNLFRSGNLDAALACCDKALAVMGEHADLRALKLRIEEAQCEQTGRLIAATEQAVEAEPDLDRRIELLKVASERFSKRGEYFTSSYRVATEKRELVELLVKKAHNAKEENRPADALRAWDFVRSFHPGYPMLEVEVERLEKQREEPENFYGGREEIRQQIRTAIGAREFAGALHLIDTAQRGVEADPALAELGAAAVEGSERERLAGDLLEKAASLANNSRYDEALSKLVEASALDVRSREIVAARHQALLEQARSFMPADWQRAKALLERAMEIASALEQDTAKKLLAEIEERSRRERLSEASDRIRQLERMHDFEGALRTAEQVLAENPDDLELTQTAKRLRQNKLRRLPLPDQPAPAPVASGRATLRAAWAKATTMGHRSRTKTAPLHQQRALSAAMLEGSDSSSGVASSKTPGTGADGPELSAAIPPQFPRSRRILKANSVPIILIGAVVALSLLALLLPRRQARVPDAPHPPAVVPHVTTPVTLSLHLHPDDAQLTVDGAAVLPRDGELKLLPGTHRIEARSPGYNPFSQSVEISAASRDALNIALIAIPKPPAVRVETDLPSGSVLVDNKPVGALEGGQFSEDMPNGPHKVEVLSPSGGRYSFSFDQEQNPIWNVDPPRSTAYGTPILAALSASGAHIICSRRGIAFKLDDRPVFACTAQRKDFPALSNGPHTLKVFDGSRTVAVHSLEYAGTPLLAALITTGAQYGGLAVQGNEDTFDVSVNAHTSKRPAAGGHWRRLLKPGDYTIAFSKPGFQAQPPVLSVSVTPGVDTLKRVSFTPLPQKAHFRLQSQPGTDVTLNGKPAGTVPESGTLDLPQLAVGSADLRLRHPGFADMHQTVTLSAGENQRTILLEELKAKINVDVEPANSQVFYSKAGRSSRQMVQTSSLEVPAGTYVFEASAPGRSSASSTITVTPGESGTVSLRLNASSPTARSLDLWPGWDAESGWLRRDKPGPIFRTLPDSASSLTFSARWEREKTLVHWSSGPLNLVFRTADGARTVNFRITDKSVSWTLSGQGQREEGRYPLNLGRNTQTIEADIHSAGITMSINGAPVANVGLKLAAESKPLQFGFIIDQDQIVRLKDIRVRMMPTASN